MNRFTWALVAVVLALGGGGIAWSARAEESAETAVINTRYLLSDTAGRVVMTDTFAGRFQLLTFGYTSCEEICPVTLTTLGLVLSELGDRAPELQAIFISVDPARDSTVALRAYLSHFDGRILGLTGPPEFVHSAAEHFRVIVKQVAGAGGGADYAVNHTAGMYLLGRDGEFLMRLPFGLSAAEIATQLRRFIDVPQPELAPAS